MGNVALGGRADPQNRRDLIDSASLVKGASGAEASADRLAHHKYRAMSQKHFTLVSIGNEGESKNP